MARQREMMVGRRDRFAVKVAFLPDPDEGRAATPEESISWGGIEIWANGHNVCRHIEQGETIDAAHWYLLPILRWLAANWDFLLHEERLPAKNAARDAWMAMQRTAEPPPGLADEDAEQWEVRWHDWWQRHSLLAARQGGLLPNLLVRRWRDFIEFSWGERPIAGAPNGFRFDAIHGCARFPCGEVAEVLYGVLDDASSHLTAELPASAALAQLRSDVRGLEETDRRRRLGLLSGFRPDALRPEERWRQIENLFPRDLPEEVSRAIFDTQADGLVVTGAPRVALMFGSVSPNIDEADARTLAGALVRFCAPGREESRLTDLVEDVPVEGSDERAWKQGYQLAEDFLAAVGMETDGKPPIDVDALLRQFGIAVESITLHDRSVRAVAVAGPAHRPAVLLNESYEYQSAQPRRFTLAHELCHILHDRGYGARLALASGPWAPVDVEKRANAFAAMLLMPTEQVASVVRNLARPLDFPDAIWEIANTFQTSFTATLEHLCNLGHIDETTRDALREEIDAKVAASNHSPRD